MTDIEQIVSRLSDAQKPRRSRTVYSVGEAIKWQSELARLRVRAHLMKETTDDL